MNEYRLIKKIGEGTFSDVFKALSLNDDTYVAIKCMKKKFKSSQAITHLQEVKVLKALCPHENIVKIQRILFDEPTGQLALVFELMEENLYEAIIKNNNKTSITQDKIREFMYKVLRAINYMHNKGYFHRDIKPENILVSGSEIKLADFGTAKSKTRNMPYTEYIATRWYRPPQCLLTSGYYGAQMDMWGFGCVLFEAITRYPLFNGRNQVDQINKINKIIGSPSEQLIQQFKPYATHMKPKDWVFSYHKGISFSRLLPNSPPQLIDFLSKILLYDPKKRLTAQQALNHPYFLVFSSPRLQKHIFSSPSPKMHKKVQEGPLDNTTSIDQKTLPPIHQYKALQLKPGLFNQTIGSKLKKPLWQKLRVLKKY